LSNSLIAPPPRALDDRDRTRFCPARGRDWTTTADRRELVRWASKVEIVFIWWVQERERAKRKNRF
jgi:hypothetical protein